MNSASEFERLLAGVRAIEATNFAQRAALATIVRTRGSTFRRPGASMLVTADGNAVCALSGGCPENDIITRARNVIANDRAEIARYNDASSGDLLFEAGCGGELDVLIEPLASSADVRFLDVLAQMQAERRSGFMATLFGIDQAPLPRPLRLIWNAAVVSSTIDDEQLAAAVVATGRALAPESRAVALPLAAAHGTFEVLFERVQPTQVLVLVGVNAVAAALARNAVALGWKAVVVDHRRPANPLPAGLEFIECTPATLREKVAFGAHTSAVVMTFNLERDCAWLRVLADVPLGYLGAIGSRERAARMQEAVAGTRVRLYAPAGLDLGAETPEEIAIAVSAEILGVLNARDGGSLRDSTRPIHP